MKKIKLFGVIALALSLGLTACGNSGNSSGKSSTSKHVHTAAADAKWQSDDGYHWKDCKDNDGGKVDRAAHTFGDPYDVVAATCEAAGSQKVKCSVCNAEVTQSIPALGHDWVDDETGGTPATCTEAGSKNQHCSRCNATQQGVVVEALGHDYGEWTTVEGKAATCELGGQEKRVCTRCGNEETRDVDALGHDFQLGDDQAEPEAGKAAVRLYHCTRCEATSLGFKANEVSAESKTHLVIGDDGGARFWGRPIGNALALDEDGTSVNQQDNEIVYCTAETGDFFEYVFDLTAEQAATLATCRCYCDAMSANHLSGDFWAVGRSSTEWTPGYYIDGGADHVQTNDDGTPMMVKDHARAAAVGEPGAELETEVQMGKRIDDYRYVLYVDDQVQAFDKDIAVSVSANVRKEYVMPFTFHLHEGENKISLRMAGGYRSTFYNFTFRPYVEPTPVVIGQESLTIKEGETAQITSEMTDLIYKSADATIASVSETGLVTGLKAGSTTITVSKAGNFKDFKLPVTVNEKEGVIRVEAETGTSEGDVVTFRAPSSGGSGQMVDSFPEGAALTLTFNAETAGKYSLNVAARGTSGTNYAEVMSVKVNNADVTISGTHTASSSRTFVETLIGEVDLVAGENTIIITHTAGTIPNLDYIRLIPVAA